MQNVSKYEDYGRAFAIVHLDRIENNLLRLKSRLRPGSLCMAVVKADAYGHGAVAVAGRIRAHVDYFGVATVEEAVELRHAGISAPILVLSYVSPLQFDALLEYNITPTLWCPSSARRLAKLARGRGVTSPVHIAVDTGMGRIGLPPTALGADTVAGMYRLDGIRIEGIFSHFATADRADTTVAMGQISLFDRFASMLEARGVYIPIKHISASAAAMTLDAQYSMCRFGLAMYGEYPSAGAERSGIPLDFAMEVGSRVIQVKYIKRGQSIGYGHLYTATSRRKIATVSIGYADGFNRALGSGGFVLANGKRAPVVGAVCMDHIMVDVTECGGVRVGDTVTVLGESGGERITPDTLGALCQSFTYEVLCNFSRRVKRIYYE